MRPIALYYVSVSYVPLPVLQGYYSAEKNSQATGSPEIPIISIAYRFEFNVIR